MNPHWQFFEEFCRYEQLTGGPDPHMRAVIHLASQLPDPDEQIWRVALYVGVYNVPSAEAIWRHWPIDTYLSDPSMMEPWLEKNWKGLKLRRERRTVKSPAKLAVYLAGVSTTLIAMPSLKNAPFERVWDFALSLPHVGRYAATKLTECWSRLGLVNAKVQDIRAKGGWSPREALVYLFPDAGHDPYNDQHVTQANELAELAYSRMIEEAGLTMSWFEFEVFLCEYKASYSTKRQYPGRSLDSELTYERAIAEYWGNPSTEHMTVRRALSPSWALGEMQGWAGVRDELGPIVSTHGYTWTDKLYDYRATLAAGDFANPVRKPLRQQVAR